MKKKLLKILFLLVVIGISLFLSLKIAFFLGKTFFFDKLIYQKSAQYGYILQNGKGWDWDNPIYRDRNNGVWALRNALANQNNKQAFEILGNNSDQVFRIAVFGDSYVWGQGITNQERFVNLLEKKLSKIRPTKIYVFALPGDSIFDNYIKYKQTQSLGQKYDLLIFGMVGNDLIFSNDDRYDINLARELENWCLSRDIALDSQLGDEEYTKLVEQSTAFNSRNFCDFQHLLPMLPKQNTIYYDFDGFRTNWSALDTYVNGLRSAGLSVFSPQKYYQENQNKYRNFFDRQSFEKFSVSKKDGHPSALTNRLFADDLFQEITTNPNWKFVKDKP